MVCVLCGKMIAEMCSDNFAFWGGGGVKIGSDNFFDQLYFPEHKTAVITVAIKSKLFAISYKES